MTVERKEGEVIFKDRRYLLIDMPGIYSLTAYTLEELVTRKILLEEKPDLVVDVIDATNLERSLYLATQLMELDIPLIIALNMSDEAKAQGIQFDLAKLSSLFGVPIILTVGHKNEGMDELFAAMADLEKNPVGETRRLVRYGQDIEAELSGLEFLIEEKRLWSGLYDSRWLAVKLLEQDREVMGMIGDREILAEAEEAARRMERLLGDPPEIIMAERRYGFISGACQEAVRTTVEARHSMSDRIDDIVMSEFFGIPILLVLMYAVFYLTFKLGGGPQKLIEYIFSSMAVFVSSFWPAGAHNPLRALLVEGIIGGVGGVVVFLPNILLLFFGIALLEDTGYTARAAFIMDRLMHKMGLHGKSFIPLLIGFGCSVPAIMSTRSLDSRRDRLITMFIIPLISCGGRFPIYAMIIPAFFAPSWQAPVLWLIYVAGILMAVLLARILSKAVFKGSTEPFVMDLPPYRIPTLKSVLVHMWEPGKFYLRKAGTLIFGASIILWVLVSFPEKKQFTRDYTRAKAEAQQAFEAGLDRLATRLGLSPAGREMLGVSLAGRENEAASRWPDYKKAHLEEAARLNSFLNALGEMEKEKGTELKESTVSTGEGTPAETQGKEMIAAASFYLSGVKQPMENSLTRIERLVRNEQLSFSVAGRVGRAMEGVLRPLGFDWKVTTALIGAFAAKELFIAQMCIIYAVEEGEQGKQSLRENLHSDYSTLTAVCIMLFLLLGTPCIATMAVTRRESDSWRWTAFQWGGLTAVAYMVTLIVYQVGRLLI